MVAQHQRKACCVGCDEPVGADGVVAPNLGKVCPLCFEVIEIVYEIEIEKVRAARKEVEKFVDDLRRGVL